MTRALLQLRVLAGTETILRLRKGSTGVLFLFLCGSAYLLMPDSREGHALFLIDERRVILNSAATAIASALMGCIVLLLVGFYIVSNSIGRDARSGVGRLIASTPVPSVSYLAGKFFGNVLYLTIVAVGFMLACMGMHLLRGEAPLEPLVYVGIYGVLFPPLIMNIAAIALFFETVPFLSGRVGDVIYFLLAVPLFTLPLALAHELPELAWLRYLDVTGSGAIVSEISRLTNTTHFSIGWSPYNPGLPPEVFPDFTWDRGLLVERLVTSFVAFPIIGLAWVAFQRFDPAWVQIGKRRQAGFIANTLRRFSFAIRRLLIPSVGWFGGPPSILRATMLDIRLSLATMPVIALIALVFIISAFVAPIDTLRSGFLPIMFAVLVPCLAAVPTRDRTHNVLGFICAAPLLQNHYALWKLFSTIGLTFLIGGAFVVRMVFESPWSGWALAGGLVLIASSAFFFGTVSSTPKPFAIAFLLFLYLALNSRTMPGFDFAGWNQLTTPAILSGYLLVSVAMVLVGFIWHGWRTRILAI
jgi:hypothetical protein